MESSVPSIVPQMPPSTSEAPPVPSVTTPKIKPEAKPQGTDPAPANSPFDSGPAPKAPEPPKTAPQDDLFSSPQPIEPAMKPAEPAKPSGDDLFSSPQPSEPAMKPAEPAAPATDDLFSTPSPAPSEPAMKPVEPAPATPPVDDLFSQPAASEPAMKPAPPVDDLFGTPPDSAPASPAAPAPIDDLFGTPSEAAPKTPPAKSDIEDLFKSSSTEPSTEQPTGPTKSVSTDGESEPNFDSLFGNPKEMLKEDTTKPSSQIQMNANEAQPSSTNTEKKVDGGLDDLFKTSSAPVENQFKGADFREWIDNTGDYSVQGRLAVIYPDRIRLIKENGKFTTVPISRLSESDRDYVTWVAVSLSNGPAAKFVNTEIDPGVTSQDFAR